MKICTRSCVMDSRDYFISYAACTPALTYLVISDSVLISHLPNLESPALVQQSLPAATIRFQPGPWVSLSPSIWLTFYQGCWCVQSRDHILLTQRNLLGLPGSSVTWREMCSFGTPACSSLCKRQQRAGHQAKLTFHFGTHFRITLWQNIHSGVYLGSKLEKCCFPLLSVGR